MKLNNFFGGEDFSAIAQQSNGGYFLAGAIADGMFVARTTPAGKLDLTFGHLGGFYFSFGRYIHTISAAAVDASDRLIVVGSISAYDAANTSKFAVARITPDGKLDRRFSGDGMTTIDFGQAHATANAVAIDAQGRIVVAGQSDDGHRDGLADPRNGAGKTFLVAVLGRIHASDDAEFGGGEGGDAEVKVHLASSDEEMFHPGDVLANDDARDHRREQIEPDDAAIEPGEIGHSMKI